MKIHHLIEIIERYHDLFRRIYAIIIAKILDIDSNSILQMIFKALNDFANFNDLVLIFFIFDAYFRMIKMNVFSSTIIQRSIAMRKTINEVRKSIAIRQMNDVLNMRNDSSTILIHDLSLNSLVLMYRERNADQSKL